MNLTFSTLGAILVSQLPQPSLFPAVPWEKHLPLPGSWGWRTPPPCHPDDTVLDGLFCDLAERCPPKGSLMSSLQVSSLKGLCWSLGYIGRHESDSILGCISNCPTWVPSCLRGIPKRKAVIWPLFIPESHQTLNSLILNILWLPALPLLTQHAGQVQLLALPALGAAQGLQQAMSGCWENSVPGRHSRTVSFMAAETFKQKLHSVLLPAMWQSKTWAPGLAFPGVTWKAISRSFNPWAFAGNVPRSNICFQTGVQTKGKKSRSLLTGLMDGG